MRPRGPAQPYLCMHKYEDRSVSSEHQGQGQRFPDTVIVTKFEVVRCATREHGHEYGAPPGFREIENREAAHTKLTSTCV